MPLNKVFFNNTKTALDTLSARWLKTNTKRRYIEKTFQAKPISRAKTAKAVIKQRNITTEEF